MIVERKISRPRPIGPPHAYQTYSVQTPKETHFRKATCAEINCDAWREGWTLRVQDLDERLWATIKASKKRYRRMDLTATEGYLIFEPGQACFHSFKHVTRIDKPEIYLVGRGDWRTFIPQRAQVFKKPEHWVEHMYDHLDLLKRKSRGE